MRRIWLAIVVVCGCSVTQWGLAGERYVAWLADGTRVTTKALTAWSFRLENRELLDGENPVRFVRDTAVAIETKSPLIVMANGDCLPGSIAGLEPASGQGGQARRVQV